MTCNTWPPPRRLYPLHVAVPGSVLSTEPSLQLKTIKAGQIARVLAIYRVDHVWLFKDPDTERRDLRLLEVLLKYTSTPAHLRRRVYPLTPLLKYAGLLPPLNLVNHDPPREPKIGDVIDGYVDECRGGECRVYLGSIGYGTLPGRAKPGSIVTVRVKGAHGRILLLEKASWGSVYTGFRVSMKSSLQELVEAARREGFEVIATSRLGECADSIRADKGLLIVFGGPYRGLLEYTRPEYYDRVVNTVPYQGVKTVRTEEAMHATLSKV